MSEEQLRTTFRDYENRDWDLALDFARLKRIKQELQIDLLNLHTSPEILERFEREPEFLVDVISVVLSDAIQGANLTAEQFAAGLVRNGRCQPLQDATEALLGAIMAFSPPAKARALATLWTKAQTLTQTTLQHMVNRAVANYERIEQAAKDKMDQEFEEHLQEIFGTSLKSGADTSASLIMTPSPSGSSTADTSAANDRNGTSPVT